MDLTTIGFGVAMFTFVVLAMVGLLLVAKSKLVSTGKVRIVVNGDEAHALQVNQGGSLLATLADNKLFVPSACGGGGTCAQCKVVITEGNTGVLPTEEGHINRTAAKEGCRLACQVKVKQDMHIEVPASVFSAKKWECEVVSNHNVATFIKEFKVRLPKGERIDFRNGEYVQIEIPPYKDLDYHSFDVEERFHEDWDKYKVWDSKAWNDETVERAYSMANYPAEGDDIVMLNVRIASPPPRSAPDVPGGKASSFIFNCKPGDKVLISGPFGEFHLKDTKRECCFIGGGAGMAPLRSHIMHMFRTLKTDRKVTYWYGARSKREIFYQEDFEAIAREFPNFEFHIALSEPKAEDEWKGYTGFIHNVVLNEYLSKHSSPEDIEYYLCGPPIMNSSVLKMLDDLGVDPEMIDLDDFGG
ncbi:MAG: NADH:ubiquinone reductase (Na(+)-transporting) subunit F [Planctomycetota bacterium]